MNAAASLDTAARASLVPRLLRRRSHGSARVLAAFGSGGNSAARCRGTHLASCAWRSHRSARRPADRTSRPRRLAVSPFSAYARGHRLWRRQHQSMLRYTPCLPRLKLSLFCAHTHRHRLWRGAPLDDAALTTSAAPDALIAKRARTPSLAVAAAVSLDAAAHAMPAAPDAPMAQRARMPSLAVAAAVSLDAAAHATLAAIDDLTAHRARTPSSAVQWRRQCHLMLRQESRLLRLTLSLLSAHARTVIGRGGGSVT
jgi:hypothetical protein